MKISIRASSVFDAISQLDKVSAPSALKALIEYALTTAIREPRHVREEDAREYIGLSRGPTSAVDQNYRGVMIEVQAHFGAGAGDFGGVKIEQFEVRPLFA